MTMKTEFVDKAAKLSQSGKKREARLLLQTVVEADPGNEKAWLLYLDTFSSDQEMMQALQDILQRNPNNKAALQFFNSLALQGTNGAAPRLPAGKKPLVRDFKRAFFTMLMIYILSLGLVVLMVLTFLRDNPFSKADELQTSYDTLQFTHDVLTDEYEHLNEDHRLLFEAYSGLTEEYAVLYDEYSSVYNESSLLQGQVDELAENPTSTPEAYAFLPQHSSTPPFVHLVGSKLYIALTRQDQSIEVWEVPYESLESALKQGHQNRSDLTYRMLSTAELPDSQETETFLAVDVEGYVDPSPFGSVMQRLYGSSDGGEAFISEVWQLVVQLQIEATEIRDTPRHPLETLLAGGGDCEDTAILFASMIQAAPVDWQVALVYMDARHPAQPQDVNHLLVFINTGDAEYYIETTNKENMQPYENYDVNGWHVNL